MSKPATEMRLARASEGFTQVIGRGNASIITKDSSTGKCCFDAQVGGGWHYGAGLETDTAWEQDSVAEYYKMVKAGYNLRARKLFNAGDLIQWTDPGSGQYVKFQPVNFQWIDGTTGSNSLISVAQAVSSPTIDDDKLYWANAFGAGRHFRYTASPTKLIKHLIIDSAANIPACPTYITNPWLELTFTLTPSTGVTMYVDGLAWNQATTKTTASAIEFRLPSGQVVWSMAAPLAYDSSSEGIPCNGQIKLYVNKKIKYAAVRFPKSWIDAAAFPIMLDPTVDYQVGANDQQGHWTPTVFTAGPTNNIGTNYSVVKSFAFWDNVTIPDDATIDSAYAEYYYVNHSGTPPTCVIKFVDNADPAVITGIVDGNGRTLTTASVNWVPGTSAGWNSTSELEPIITELMGYSFASGAAMQILITGPDGSANNLVIYRTYEFAGNVSGAKLHIEYTEASTDLEPALVGGKLIFGGLALNGLVGR